MPLVFGFGMLAAGVLLLTMGVTGATARQVAAGQASEVYGQNVTTTETAPAAASSGATNSTPTAAQVNTATEANIPSSGTRVATLKAIASSKGWDAGEISAWLGVIGDEDGSWSLTAQNPTSSAYGIAQFINGPGEYAKYGGDVNTLSGQLTAMANYISQRYGTPSNALAHENEFHWY